MLREAPNAEKGERLAALENARCEAADLCELRRVCVEGYRQHIAALNETARAKTLLGSADGAIPAAAALDSARRDLALAAPIISRCADAQGAAHRHYKF